MFHSPSVTDLSECRVALVVNGAAGKKDGQSQQGTIREKIAPRVREFTICSVTKGNRIADAAKQAAKDGADIVVALGGDGTQSAVAGALAGGTAVMGVLPGGTFNYFARELGVGDTVDAALDTLLAGHVRQMDLGEVNGRIFLNNASFGVYPEILERREAIYRRWGRSRMAAYWSVLVTLWDTRDPMTMAVTMDGETRQIRTSLAFAARSAFQLESLGLEGADAIREGRFALFLAKGQKRHELVATAFRLAFGKVAAGRDFDMVTAEEIMIETRKARRLLAFDGEKERMEGPFRLRVHHGALSVIVPAPAAENQTATDPKPTTTGAH